PILFICTCMYLALIYALSLHDALPILTFDVIVIDPPSFARNKKHTFSVAKDYHRLISQALDILADNGIIIASTNASNVSVAQFKDRKSTRLNSSHVSISYAVFCLNIKQ